MFLSISDSVRWLENFFQKILVMFNRIDIMTKGFIRANSGLVVINVFEFLPFSTFS